MLFQRAIVTFATFATFVASAQAAIVVFNNPLTGNTSLLAIICTVADKLFGVLLIIGVIAFLAAAFLYLTAGGNAQKVGTARKAFTAAIVGVLLAMLAFGVPSMVAALFNVPASSLPSSCT